ncbi:hypothetical protein K2X05_03845 [bacterium]|nr:hypothetical protein [bacterium]
MILNLLALLLQTQSFAAGIQVSEKELLSVTGIQKSFLLKSNEDALESLLSFEDEGISCEMDEFSIEGYTITEGTANAPKKFEVINRVTGPTNFCGGTATYTCYTYFYLKNGQWLDLGSECDDSTVFNE